MYYLASRFEFGCAKIRANWEMFGLVPSNTIRWRPGMGESDVDSNARVLCVDEGREASGIFGDGMQSHIFYVAQNDLMGAPFEPPVSDMTLAYQFITGGGAWDQSDSSNDPLGAVAAPYECTCEAGAQLSRLGELLSCVTTGERCGTMIVFL